jgi:hypothetical protein
VAAIDKKTTIEFSMDEPSIRMHGNGFTVGTCEYSPTTTEKPFYDRLDEAARSTIQSKPGGTTELSNFTLKGHTGQFVSWLGIVRRIDRNPQGEGGKLLVENKYFVGLSDCHIQTVEITGAGDFEVELGQMHDGVIPLVLVRVYGQVTGDHGDIPTIKPEYIRLWHFGQFNFSDLFGEDHGNPEWKKRMSLPLDETVYHMGTSRKYYEQLLGPTKEEWEEIAAWHRAQTEIDASDDPYEAQQRTVAYEPMKWEEPYFLRLAAKDRITVKSKPSETERADFQLRGHVHQFVSWFGIVRKAAPHITKAGGTLLLENKYFKGSSDERRLTVSICGGGDFKAELTHFSKDLVPLTLVRIYGSITREDNELPVIEAAYVRVWDLDQYQLHDYGVDRTNARWTRNRQLKPGERVYAPEVSADYYIKRLGPTAEQAAKIRDLFKWKEKEKAEHDRDKASPTGTTTITPSPSP